MQKHAEKCFEWYLEKNRVTWLVLSKATLSKEGVSTDRELLRHRVLKYVPRIEQVFLRYELTGNKNLQTQRYGLAPFPGHTEHELAGTADFFDHEKRTVFEMKVTTNKEWLNKDQLLFYVALFTALDKAKVSRIAFIAPLMQHPIIEVPFEYYDVRGVLRRCLDAIQLIEAGKFTPAGKSRMCYGCKFRGAECPAWAVRAIDTSKQHFGMRAVKF
jgi:CRISPR/Cas system-associated exonuclease Cas4 (RecB family)